MIKIGGHVSAAGGLVNAIKNAEHIGANCIQLFASSPRKWEIDWPAKESVDAFIKARKEADISPVFIHAPYLINLASPNAFLASRSAKLLKEYLEVSDIIGADGVIFHIGSGKELPEDKAFELVVGQIKDILKKCKGKSKLIIENAAGGGAKIGDTLLEVGEIMAHAKDSRLAFCFDTAHYFEAGQIEKYDKENVANLAGQIKSHIGKEKFVAMHVNDSKTAFNSHHDRHENIGRGYIGLSGFKNLAKEKLFRETPWILEVPGFDNNGPDKKNIDIAKELF